MGKKITIDFSKATEEKTIEKTSKEKKPRKKRGPRKEKLSDVYTFEGHQLTIKEAKFIDEYLEHGNQRQAVIKAGYTNNEATASQLGSKIINKDYIAREIKNRMNEHKNSSIATREEIMEFFSDMMRGKILDQFDLPANNSDKIKAGVELAKRCIDIEDKIKEKATQVATPEIKISLAWEGRNGEKK